MDNSENTYSRLNNKMMSLLGLLHSKTNKERLVRHYILGFLILYFTSAEFCQLLTVDFDLQSILSVLQILVPCMSVTNIYYNYVLQFVTIQKMFCVIKQDCQRLKDDAERNIMRKYTHQCKLFTLIIGLSCIFFVSFAIVPPVLRKILFSKKEKTTTDIFPVFSCHTYFLDSETYYYPILIYQVIIVVLVTLIAINCYSSYFTVIQHIYIHLSIIKYKINKPFIDNHYGDNVLATPVDQSDWIIDIAQRLARTREITAMMNAVSETCYLFQIVLACVVIIIGFLRISVLLSNKESEKDILMFIIFVSGSLFITYINCYVGQRVIDCSMEVYREVCLVPIHEISLDTQKLLLSTLMLNMKPITVSIGKIFVASHELFKSLLRMSLSFAMVLHSVQDI